MPFWPYVAAYPPCSGRPMTGTAKLQLGILDRFDRALDYGIYNCRASTSNATVPSIHSDGRAGDTGFPVYSGQPHTQGFQLTELLRKHAYALGIMGIIWDRRRYDARTPWGRAYTGPNPHIDHVHWEQHPDLAVTLDLDTAYRLIGEEPMAFTPEEEKALVAIAPYATFLAGLSKGIMGAGPSTGLKGSPTSLLHVLEVHRLVAQGVAGVTTDDLSGDNHLAISARLLGQ